MFKFLIIPILIIHGSICIINHVSPYFSLSWDIFEVIKKELKQRIYNLTDISTISSVSIMYVKLYWTL